MPETNGSAVVAMAEVAMANDVQQVVAVPVASPMPAPAVTQPVAAQPAAQPQQQAPAQPAGVPLPNTNYVFFPEAGEKGAQGYGRIMQDPNKPAAVAPGATQAGLVPVNVTVNNPEPGFFTHPVTTHVAVGIGAIALTALVIYALSKEGA